MERGSEWPTWVHLFVCFSVFLPHTHGLHSTSYLYTDASILCPQEQVEIPATAFTICGKKRCSIKIIFSKWTSMCLYLHRRSSLRSPVFKSNQIISTAIPRNGAHIRNYRKCQKPPHPRKTTFMYGIINLSNQYTAQDGYMRSFYCPV